MSAAEEAPAAIAVEEAPAAEEASVKEDEVVEPAKEEKKEEVKHEVKAIKKEEKPAQVKEGKPAPVLQGKPREHVIALLQPTKHDATRTYLDFGNVTATMEGLLKMFETKLKEQNPSAANVSYDYNSLCQYLDEMKEVCILSWDVPTTAYKRFDRAWVKQSLHDYLANAVPDSAGRRK
eukprot:CAMPEP_0119101794 /NCGR_PEP_ID=MMETSP1180-20130426/746_1 /TAXON_ID=3052 ORGANISM="Chlamydomonas cf sp, Strain CCMP681" /NCGR_SAMPLE_ID=MMETSP1180 /ASSEMBLY_ACC=CAM_ASM_000741 /LENGTH=177 /DNA_ID=CAMNT_0007085969 /DNA_START=9 /DNA_END=542 /DNA_ORIENTATION=+